MNWRLRLYTLLFTVVFVMLGVRLFYWQVYEGKNLAIQARGQYVLGESIDAERGDILANDGSWLAASGEAWLVYATLNRLGSQVSEIADKLAVFFVDPQEEDYKQKLLEEANRLKELLSRDGAVWVPLKNRVNPETKKQIESLGIGGIGFERQEARLYPEGSISAHLLGFVGKDADGKDQGYFGLEGNYDLTLKGKEGFMSRESDARGVPIIFGNEKEAPAIGGINLKTHVDKTVQLIVENKLREGIEMYGAESGTIITMDPYTGGIMAMASYPSFDPSKYWEYSDELFLNPAISLSFEPGSVFKVVVMAAALDAGVVESDTICDICDRAFKVDKYFIKTWNDEYHPDSNMEEVIVNSDNVGMVFVAQKLGIDKMYNYLKSFGLGSLSGIDLQGEATPNLREQDDWSIVDLATSSFGQGIAVTPIQMVRAVSVIANGGKLVTPQIVDKMISGDWEDDINEDSGTRVISEKAALETTAMMVSAAKHGEWRWTRRKGMKVAGKTGTAQIPIAGHYDQDKTNATFIGFAPYDNPKFVMLVTMHAPTASPWASGTSAPLWYSIAEELYSYFGIQPEN